MVAQERFTTITDIVIDNLEGGYFHPTMMKDGRLKPNPLLNTSGETMFGIDRKNGVQLSEYPAWKAFWQMIDQAGAKNKWRWNYRGGSLEQPLKALAIQMMWPWFIKLFKKYLTPQAQSAVANDERLILHFSYASWNGEGWFKRFADKINKQVVVDNNIEKLATIALRSRTDSTVQLIRQSGEKIAKLNQSIDSKKKK